RHRSRAQIQGFRGRLYHQGTGLGSGTFTRQANRGAQPPRKAAAGAKRPWSELRHYLDTMNLLFGTPQLEGLNPAQSEAVRHTEGPILVLAGAGSGKTRVLTSRISRLIEEHGVRPSEVLAVTFTNKAAGEMRDRVARLLGSNAAGMWIGTFHAIGARLLRSSAHLGGRTPNFTIYDEDDSLVLLKRVMEQAGVDHRTYAPKAVLASISVARNALVSPEEFESLARDPFSRNVAEVFKRLEPAMRCNNA